MIGEQFRESDEICGSVISIRAKQEKLALWTKTASNEAAQVSPTLFMHNYHMKYNLNSFYYIKCISIYTKYYPRFIWCNIGSSSNFSFNICLKGYENVPQVSMVSLLIVMLATTCKLCLKQGCCFLVGSPDKLYPIQPVRNTENRLDGHIKLHL